MLSLVTVTHYRRVLYSESTFRGVFFTT